MIRRSFPPRSISIGFMCSAVAIQTTPAILVLAELNILSICALVNIAESTSAEPIASYTIATNFQSASNETGLVLYVMYFDALLRRPPGCGDSQVMGVSYIF